MPPRKKFKLLNSLRELYLGSEVPDKQHVVFIPKYLSDRWRRETVGTGLSDYTSFMRKVYKYVAEQRRKYSTNPQREG